jgi:2,3-bisphosphoglycerate-independent phosphoglycerate mutase
MAQYKGVIVILDGLGDRSMAALDGSTPLERAKTPNMDRLAAEGLCGLVDPLLAGLPVGTHTGTAVLMGLPPGEARRLPRGPVEAAGIGLVTVPGDVLVRCNLATLERVGDQYLLLDRRAGRISQGVSELCAQLQDLDLGDGITATVTPATHHRLVLRLRGGALSPDIKDTDPGSLLAGGVVLSSVALDAKNVAAVRTAAALNRFNARSFEILEQAPLNSKRRDAGLLPANGVICRSAGFATELKSILGRFDVSAALVVGEQTVAGLGRLLGYTVIQEPAFTAMPDTDLEGKIAAVTTALQTHDLVFLHVKAPDICSHDRQPEAKQAFLERFDRLLGSILMPGLVVAVSGDHSTDSATGRHTGDPVPTILSTPGGRRDQVAAFGECHCMGGGLGRITGTSLVASVLDAMNRLPNYSSSHRKVWF